MRRQVVMEGTVVFVRLSGRSQRENLKENAIQQYKKVLKQACRI